MTQERPKRKAHMHKQLGPIFAYTRHIKLKTRHDVAKMENHARRIGQLAQKRRVREGPRWIGAVFHPTRDRGEPLRKLEGSTAADIRWAYDAQVATLTPGRKSGYAAHHFLIGISSEWIAEAGNVHDPKNPRVKALLASAREWVQKEFGGVIHARYDVDEAGSGVVDVIAVSARSYRQGRERRPSYKVANGKSMEEFRQRINKPKIEALERELGREPKAEELKAAKTHRSYVACQDSWVAFARETLGYQFLRGRPREETLAKHMRPEEYGRMQDDLKAATEAREAATTELEAAREAKAKAQAELEAAATQRKTLAAHEQALERDKRAFQDLIAGEVRNAAKKLKRALGRRERLRARDFLRSLVHIGGKYVTTTLGTLGAIANPGRDRSTIRLDRARTRLAYEWEHRREVGHTRGAEIEGAGLEH